MHTIVSHGRGLIGRISLLATLAMLSACAPAQESAWQGTGMSSGKVGILGPSGPIGP